MGWSITLKSNQKIERQESNEIIYNLPKKLRGPWEQMGRSLDKGLGNGWSTACDIHEPEDLEWRIGGSYGMSGHIAEEMANHLKNELETKNHKIKIVPNW